QGEVREVQEGVGGSARRRAAAVEPSGDDQEVLRADPPAGRGDGQAGRRRQEGRPGQAGRRREEVAAGRRRRTGRGRIPRPGYFRGRGGRRGWDRRPFTVLCTVYPGRSTP